jgi:hypothetical protein
MRLLLGVGLALLGACAPAPETVSCHRLDVPSMGPENGFRTRVEGDSGQTIDDPRGRIDIAITSASPLTGPVTLVQAVDGREVGRWDILPPASPGIVQRCSLGFSTSGPACGASLSGHSLPIRGEWALVSNDNRILEASVSFRLCD